MLMISLQRGRSAVEFHLGLIFGKQTLDETRPRSPGGNKLLMRGSGFETKKKSSTKHLLYKSKFVEVCLLSKIVQQIISTRLLNG